MAELAQFGGCDTVDVNNVPALKDAICSIATSKTKYARLVHEASIRSFKTWEQYVSELIEHMRGLITPKDLQPLQEEAFTEELNHLPQKKPKLTVCITTYNRKKWLSVNIRNFLAVSEGLENEVELVVCDNNSCEGIRDILKEHKFHKNVSIYQNSANIGMLDNFTQTISFANGEYVWLIGDDDIIHQGALQNILKIIDTENPALINLNYNASRADVPETVESLHRYLSQAQNYSVSTKDLRGAVKDISAQNENFYTAIYSFVAQRRFMWRIFQHNTSGQLFSSLQSCVPSSKYILSNMMEEQGYWLNEPAITINLNVSWGEYANIWLLERIPEVYDLAQLNGVPGADIAHWRAHTFKHSLQYLDDIHKEREGGTAATFDFARFIRRLQGVSVARYFPVIRENFVKAKNQNLPCTLDISLDEFEAIISFHKE